MTKGSASRYEDADEQGDYRRDELEEYLTGGAREDALKEWAITRTRPREYAIVLDDTFGEYDFVWNLS